MDQTRSTNPRRTTGVEGIDTAISGVLDAVNAHLGAGGRHIENRDQLREILVTAARMSVDAAENRADRLDLKIANAALTEMRDAYLMLGPHRGTRKVTIFGSARTGADDPLYDLTRRTAAAFADAGWMVITGAGPGIMAAGLEGAGKAHALGVAIRLPFESEANEFVEERNLVDMRYFFTRKLALMRESDGFVVMPGGFGTLDEMFEILTLLQTGKSEPVPVVLLGLGQGFWHALDQFVAKMVDDGYVSGGDRRLYRITNDVDEAVSGVLDFYRNFHSVRWVGNQLVLRMQRGPTDAQLDAVSNEFAPFTVDGGGVARCKAHAVELNDQDHVDLVRISLAMNRRQPGKLRNLIDRVNEW